MEILLKEEDDGEAESRYRPMVLTRTLQQTTPLMAAAGCPSLACVKLVRLVDLGKGFGQGFEERKEEASERVGAGTDAAICM